MTTTLEKILNTAADKGYVICISKQSPDRWDIKVAIDNYALSHNLSDEIFVYYGIHKDKLVEGIAKVVEGLDNIKAI